ncbi:MAG: hypothetical protein JST68_27925 [Bacteroidetes bacterium]|nr:hypothetical protein [Bacteroidota bacterium]
MHSEAQIQPSERYLLCTAYFSDQLVKKIKTGVKKFMENRPKDETYYRFMSWSGKKNEIAVLTTYASAGFSLPISFDFIFADNDHTLTVDTRYKATQAVWNGWTPIEFVDRGHKHILILEFDTEIPTIFSSLPKFIEGTYPDGQYLCFCNKTDFEAIKNKKGILEP